MRIRNLTTDEAHELIAKIEAGTRDEIIPTLTAFKDANPNCSILDTNVWREACDDFGKFQDAICEYDKYCQIGLAVKLHPSEIRSRDDAMSRMLDIQKRRPRIADLYKVIHRAWDYAVVNAGAA